MWEHSQSTGWAVQTPTTVGMALPWVDNTWAALHRSFFFFLIVCFLHLDYQPNVGRDFSLFISLSCSLLYAFTKKVARGNCSNTVGSSRMAVQAEEEQLQRSWDGSMLGIFT